MYKLYLTFNQKLLGLLVGKIKRPEPKRKKTEIRNKVELHIAVIRHRL